MADAAVVVWDAGEPDLRRVLQPVRRREIPVHVIGAPALRGKVRKGKNPVSPPPEPRGLPD